MSLQAVVNQKIKQVICLAVIATILTQALFMLISPHVKAAGSMYFSPASASVQIGETVDVVVRASVTGNADAVDTVLDYPADKLEYISFSAASVAPNSIALNVGGGTFSVSTYINSSTPPAYFSGDQQILTVKFKAKVDSGTGQITFGGGSKLYYDGDPQGGGSGSMTISFTAPPPPDPPKTTTTKPSTTNKTNTTTVSPEPEDPAAPPVDTVAPVVAEVKTVAHDKTKGIVITWTTDEPSSSVVEFGEKDVLGLTVEGEGNTREHTVVINPELLQPGQTVYFRVKSTDVLGNTFTSDVQSIVVAGIAFTVVVKNSDGAGVEGATVSLNGSSDTKQTDSNGLVRFDGVATGDTKVTVSKGDKTQDYQATIVSDQPEQSFAVEFNVSESKFILIVIVAVILAALVIGVAALIKLGKFKNPFKKGNGPHNPQPPSGVGGTGVGVVSGLGGSSDVNTHQNQTTVISQQNNPIDTYKGPEPPQSGTVIDPIAVHTPPPDDFHDTSR